MAQGNATGRKCADSDKQQAYSAAVLIPFVYSQLRQLARSLVAGERGDCQLQPTELVHQAYLKLSKMDRIRWQGKTHFQAMAATQMRRILVEEARRRRALKRGSGETLLCLDDVAGADTHLLSVIAVDEALQALSQRNQRQARIAEMRLFAGMTSAEISAELGVAERTVRLAWQMGRAWLADRITT